MMSEKETVGRVSHQSNSEEPGLSSVLRNRDSRFPEVLHGMLKSVEKAGHSHIVSWQPHGRCIMVHQPEKFVEQILPRFLRISSGPDKGAYYHPLFLRGKEALARDIPRVSVKGHGHRRPEATVDPNFYQMPFLAPLTSSARSSMTSNDAPSATHSQHNPTNPTSESGRLSTTLERVIAEQIGGMGTIGVSPLIQNGELLNSLATLRLSASMPQIGTPMGPPVHQHGGAPLSRLLSHSNIQSSLARNCANSNLISDSVHRQTSGASNAVILAQLLESRYGLTSSSSVPSIAMAPIAAAHLQNWQLSMTANPNAARTLEESTLRANVPMSTLTNVDLRLLLALLRRENSHF